MIKLTKGVRELILLLSVGAMAGEADNTIKATTRDYRPTKYAKRVRKGRNGKPLRSWEK